MRAKLATLIALVAMLAGASAVASTVYVYATKNGDKYHRFNCRYLGKDKIKMTLTTAKKKGIKPCEVCKPPVRSPREPKQMGRAYAGGTNPSRYRHVAVT